MDGCKALSVRLNRVVSLLIFFFILLSFLNVRLCIFNDFYHLEDFQQWISNMISSSFSISSCFSPPGTKVALNPARAHWSKLKDLLWRTEAD